MPALTRRAFAIGAAMAPFSASAKAAAPVIVGTKLDLEGALLGHMILLALRAAGIPAENKLQIGPTAILRQAILSGAIDLCVEYTGNAAFFFHQEGDPVWKDAAGGYARAADLDLRQNNLVWLAPAPADNSWVIAIPKNLSREKNIRTLEDFAAYVREGGKVKLAASAEFVESAAGLPAFEETYGFKLKASQLLVLSGGETSATMKAAADNISGVNAAMAYGTDGALKALDLHALEDPLHAEPIYAPAAVVRAATLALYPQIGDIIAPIFQNLDLETLRGLNERVAVEGEPAAKVAEEFLRGRKLIE
jgi:osmoprotectant transport system substrate-binding protein